MITEKEFDRMGKVELPLLINLALILLYIQGRENFSPFNL